MSDQTNDPTGNESDAAVDRTHLPIRRAPGAVANVAAEHHRHRRVTARAAILSMRL